MSLFEVLGVEVPLNLFFDEKRAYFLLPVVVPNINAVEGDFGVQEEGSIIKEQIPRRGHFDQFLARVESEVVAGVLKSSFYFL